MGRYLLLSSVLIVLVCSLSVQAQRHKSYAQMPGKRQRAVFAAREEARARQAEVRAWANARGVPLRQRVNGRTRQLMAIREGRPLYYSTRNVNAAISTGASLLRNTAPYNLNGDGVVVAVWDGGRVRETHNEFGTRVEVMDTVFTDWHATHVAGTIGAGGANPLAIGMAPQVGIDSYDWNADEAEAIAGAASAPGQPNAYYLSNHSYGYEGGWEVEAAGVYRWRGSSWGASVEDEGFGQYSFGARAWDQIVYDAPYYLPFKACGNDRVDNPSPGDTVYIGDSGTPFSYDSNQHPDGDGVQEGGYDSISFIANAKNILSVGAVRDAVSGMSRNLDNAAMTSFSSWGPADDGRIKPDIVANGYTVYSADDANDSAYTTISGTSMATPNACGSAALLVEYYAELFSGGAMRASTLKGLIIHTADDLGRPGPDYQYGWGLMNVEAAAALLGDSVNNSQRVSEALLEPANAVHTYSFFNDGQSPARITLCWTDPPGAYTTQLDRRTPVLINDLDLRVTGPGGTYYPYRLSYASPTANAVADGENNVDNVEQVYIETPSAGEYTVTVDYDGSLSGGEQWYSLLIDGSGLDSDQDGLPDYWEYTHFNNRTIAVASADDDGDGLDNISEYVAGNDPNDSSSVFRITAFEPPPVSNTVPFILRWNTEPGRLYSVYHTDNLSVGQFEVFTDAIDLPPEINSYTDAVERAAQHFYRVEVRLEE